MADSIAQSGPLPSIGYLDMDKIKRESSLFGHNIAVTSALNMSAPPLSSPSNIYSGPPPPYSYPSSTASSVVGGGGTSGGPAPGGYTSPTHTRQASGDDKDPPYTAPRQSLPSINEALRSEPNISIPSLLSTAAPPQRPYVTKSPTSPSSRPYLNPPIKAPADPFPHQNPTDHRRYDPLERASRSNYSPPHPSNGHSVSQSQNTNLYNHHSSIPPRTAPSPLGYPRPNPSTQRRASSPVYNNRVAHSTPPSNTSFGYTTQPAGYSYPSGTSNGHPFRPPLYQQPPWRNGNPDFERAEEVRKATSKESPGARAAYGESVKRHLDIFDIETSLNEIAEGGGRSLEFAKHYGTHAHQTQRSGPIPGSLPTIEECDDMLRRQRSVLDSISQIKDVIMRQQQALAEQRNYDQQNFKSTGSEVDDEAHSFIDKLDGGGGFAGADAKKRRGRAAPPGRCHSCNRAETPEWRRGPDGARTLCNACGLHYAKLTRKMGNTKASTGTSNLQPKESPSTSP